MLGNKKNKIKEAVIAVTYRCNSRCVMCNIWQMKNLAGELQPKDFQQLPKNLRDINISGGEPFLRPDLPEIIQAISQRCPMANIIISTNGLATALIVKQMKQILRVDQNIGVAVSLDGMQRVHDKVRGIEGGFNKAIETIKQLKEIGAKNLKISFTTGDYNFQELPQVYQLASKLGLEFTSGIVHSSDNYFGIKNKIDCQDKIITQYEWLKKQELASWSPKRWARAYFYYGLQEFLRTGKRILPDYAGELYIFIDPQGKIYPSNVSTEQMGNLCPKLIMQNVKNKNSHSWMICTARQSIKKHWLRVILWIIKSKIKL